MKANSNEEYEIANDIMREALRGMFFGDTSGNVYVFESLFPAKNGTYLNFRGKNLSSGRPRQVILNMKEFEGLDILEPDSDLVKKAGSI